MISTKLETGEVLTFEDISHTYEIDGASCPGTSELMERMEIKEAINPHAMPYAKRGERIDLAIQYDLLGDLDESSVDSTEWGYVEAWRRFVKEHHVVPVSKPQLLVGSVNYWFATLIDLVCHIDGKLSTLNLKTGKPAKWHKIQCHLEWLLYPEAEQCRAVYLAPDGSFELDENYAGDTLSMNTAKAIAQCNGIAHKWSTTRKTRKPTRPIVEAKG